MYKMWSYLVIALLAILIVHELCQFSKGVETFTPEPAEPNMETSCLKQAKQNSGNIQALHDAMVPLLAPGGCLEKVKELQAQAEKNADAIKALSSQLHKGAQSLTGGYQKGDPIYQPKGLN
jgi:hypothetical protein